MSIEAMKLALEALEAVSKEMTVGERYTNAGQQVLDAIDHLRVATTQQPATRLPEDVVIGHVTLCKGSNISLLIEYAKRLNADVERLEAQQPATSEPVAWSEREQLRHAQAAVVMPMIGPLLDAWENSDREVMSQEPELSKQLRNINSAMEDADTHPAPSVPDDVVRDAERFRCLTLTEEAIAVVDSMLADKVGGKQ